MEITTKFVDFSYCDTCKHRDTYEGDDPCNECLTSPARDDDSRKPVMYSEDDGAKNTSNITRR